MDVQTDWRPRSRVPDGDRNSILASLAEARQRKINLEAQVEWQFAMQLAMSYGDELLLCELTSHWDWIKLQRDVRAKLESILARLEATMADDPTSPRGA